MIPGFEPWPFEPVTEAPVSALLHRRAPDEGAEGEGCASAA
jgi:hypothetical protein